jgi:hypothetical protein
VEPQIFSFSAQSNGARPIDMIVPGRWVASMHPRPSRWRARERLVQGLHRVARDLKLVPSTSTEKKAPLVRWGELQIIATWRLAYGSWATMARMRPCAHGLAEKKPTPGATSLDVPRSWVAFQASYHSCRCWSEVCFVPCLFSRGRLWGE